MKNMPNYIAVLLLFIVFWGVDGYGQPGQGAGQWQERFREMEAKRIAYITQEISLTPEEAQQFWPVYNEYTDKRNQMMIAHREQRVPLRELHDMSEEQLREVADADIQNMEEMAALRREYHEKFKEILPLKKVVLLYHAERSFNRQLYREGHGRGRQQDRRRN